MNHLPVQIDTRWNDAVSFLSLSVRECVGASDQHQGCWRETAQLWIRCLWWLWTCAENSGSQGGGNVHTHYCLRYSHVSYGAILSFPLRSPSCFETRCVSTWRRRKREPCVNEKPATETSAGTWGAAPAARGASCQVEWCVTATEGDPLLEAAWPPKWAQAQEEAPGSKERAASRPSVAEQHTACIVEVVPCSSSSTVLWKKRTFHV